MLGFAVPQFSEVARWDLGDLPRFASAAPDAVVDLMFVATGTDSHLEWVERLLAP